MVVAEVEVVVVSEVVVVAEVIVVLAAQTICLMKGRFFIFFNHPKLYVLA